MLAFSGFVLAVVSVLYLLPPSALSLLTKALVRDSERMTNDR